MQKNGNPAAEDVGNIVSLEHVNITVPDQAMATQFYVVGLGLTRDPYLMVGLENMWVNVGEEQFHLPTKEPQVVPGYIGLLVADLEGLKQRLERIAPKLSGTKFAWKAESDHVSVTCPWGNQFRCYAPSAEFGNTTLGLPYVEVLVRPGTADGIAKFYRQVIGAPATVEGAKGSKTARVRVGRRQALVFRETAKKQRPYDGHHVAVYVANFSGPYKWLKEKGHLMQDIAFHQYRFKNIVDPDSGELLCELEHEVRSLANPMYKRPLVNRNPAQSIRSYATGSDAYVPARAG